MDPAQILALLADPRVWLAVTSTIAACSAIAALTPSPKDDAIMAKVRKLVDLLAFNVGHAKNK